MADSAWAGDVHRTAVPNGRAGSLGGVTMGRPKGQRRKVSEAERTRIEEAVREVEERLGEVGAALRRLNVVMDVVPALRLTEEQGLRLLQQEREERDAATA